MPYSIKKLVELSYRNNKLDPETVEFIADKLKRKELKEYIYLLKQQENKKEVIVSVPNELNKKDKEVIQNLFPAKNIKYESDPEMISGIRITTNNSQYELSLKQMLSDIITYINTDD